MSEGVCDKLDKIGPEKELKVERKENESWRSNQQNTRNGEAFLRESSSA